MKLLTLKDRRADRKCYDGRWFSCADLGVVDIGQRNGCKVEVGHQPCHRDTQCIAHRIELGVSKAIKDHTRLRHLNDVLIFLYEQYHYTPKALRELRMLSEALEEIWVHYIFKATQVND